MKITGAQIAMARRLLQMDTEEFAKDAGLNKTTLNRAEHGEISEKTSEKIKTYVYIRGLEFIEDEGVKRRKVQPVLKGTQGLFEFYDDIYRNVAALGGELWLYNGNDYEFLKWTDAMGFTQRHIERMEALDNFTFRILVESGNTDAVSSGYAEYRWMPEGTIIPTPTVYGYGEKVALLHLRENISIQVIENKQIVDRFKEGFDLLWNKSAEKT